MDSGDIDIVAPVASMRVTTPDLRIFHPGELRIDSGRADVGSPAET